MIQVFSKNWFALHQKKLLWFANTSVGRYVLRVHGKRSSVGKNKITQILPNAILWEEKGELKAEFRTHNKFAKRLYHAFKPAWYLIHFLDWLFLDRFSWANRFSFGFLTLTVFPDADPETTTVDGSVRNIQLIATGWATILAATDGTDTNDNGTSFFISRCQENGTELACTRSIFVWDTSSLTADAKISGAVASVYITAVSASSAYTTRFTSSTPASSTAVGVADYDQIGTGALADDLLSSSATTSAYNDFTLNATGLLDVNPVGNSSFGFRDLDHDINGTEPAAAEDYRITVRSADFAGTTSDPKLVVTYSFGGGGTGMLLGV